MVNIDLKAPTSWKELTQEQLRYVFGLLAMTEDHTVVKTHMLMAFCGIEVIGKTRYGWKCRIAVDSKPRVIYLATWQIRSFIQQFSYVDQLEDMDCRLDAVCGLHAADVDLHGVSFNDYLMAEKYYQIFIYTRNMEWMDNVAMWLYRDSGGRAAGTGKAVDDNGMKVEEMTLTDGERTGTLLWYNHAKRVMAGNFTDFFQSGGSDGVTISGRDIQKQYDIQLRALTDGDPTKEAAVLSLDCWRALTELDAKAREARELEKIRNRH